MRFMIAICCTPESDAKPPVASKAPAREIELGQAGVNERRDLGEERHAERAIDEMRRARFFRAGSVVRRENLRRERAHRSCFGRRELRERRVAVRVLSTAACERRKPRKLEGHPAQGGGSARFNQEASARQLIGAHAYENAVSYTERTYGDITRPESRFVVRLIDPLDERLEARLGCERAKLWIYRQERHRMGALAVRPLEAQQRR